MNLNSVSPKVVAAAAGAGAGAIISTLLLWVLGASVFHAGWLADPDVVIAAVPSPVQQFVLLIITVAGAAIPGYATTDSIRTAGVAKLAADQQIADLTEHQMSTGVAEVDRVPDEAEDGADVGE